jgi:hypothetical protein
LRPLTGHPAAARVWEMCIISNVLHIYKRARVLLWFIPAPAHRSPLVRPQVPVEKVIERIQIKEIPGAPFHTYYFMIILYYTIICIYREDIYL